MIAELTAAAAYIVSSQQAQVTLRCGNEPIEKVCEHCTAGERWMEGAVRGRRVALTL